MTSLHRNHLPAALDDQRAALIETLVGALAATDGVCALALGGSFAEGTQQPGSDLDIGLYYRESAPFAIESIRQVAETVSSAPPVVTGFYEWGAWVNGGAWMQTPAGKVDFLYRNVDHVQRTIDEAQAGRLQLDYAQQPTFGLQNVIYLAETSICRPLYDPDGVLAGLKRGVEVYSDALKRSAIRENLWGAEFTLSFARSYAQKGDVYNTVGCLTRALGYMTQALFGLNETYFLSDKRALRTIERFERRPDDYTQRVHRILSRPGETPAELTATVGELEALFRDAVALAREWYEPKFVL